MIVHMTAKGQLPIPLAIRRKFGMMTRVPIHMDVDEYNRRIVLTPITHESIQELRGRYKGKGLLKTLLAIKRRTVSS